MAFDTTAVLQAVDRNLGYRTGTATPTVNFGGASVGVTYADQACRWTRIGDLVFFRAYVHLTSKGSSTGALFVDLGLPYVAAVATPVALYSTNIVLNSEDRSLFAEVITSGDAVRIAETSGVGPSTAVPWDNTNITDDFEVRLAGFFHV